MLLLNVKATSDLVHLLVILEGLKQKGFWRLFYVVCLKLLRGLVKVFEKQYDLARIDISLLEPAYNLSVVNRIHQHDPASVQVEHLKPLHVVLGPLITPGEEHLLGFGNAARVEQLVNLLLPRDLLHHVHFRLDRALLLS